MALNSQKGRRRNINVGREMNISAGGKMEAQTQILKKRCTVALSQGQAGRFILVAHLFVRCPLCI